MTPQELATSRKASFESLYDAFFAYFQSHLRADSTKFAKYRLQLLTVYWEDVELTRIVYPIFETMSCTLAEKQAVARAALYDALVAHSFSGHLASTSAALFARLDDEEKRVNDAFTTLSARVKNLESSKEPVNAIPKGKQVRAGAQIGK